MVTESSLAAGLTGPMSTIFGGLWLADSIGAFFEGGGAAFYHSPIQPQGLQKTCLGWASWSNFVLRGLQHQGLHSLLLCGPHDQPGMGRSTAPACTTCFPLRSVLRTRGQCAGDFLCGSSAGWKLVPDAGQSRRNPPSLGEGGLREFVYKAGDLIYRPGHVSDLRQRTVRLER